MSEQTANIPNDAAAEIASARAGFGASAPPREFPPIALLYADDALLTHVEEAITAAGVPVVCKMRVDAVDQAALVASGAKIALINLDDLCDDKLDALTASLDAAGLPVVFNDAIISRGLDGWARARWARHLAAKLRGSGDVDPPRPVQTTSSQSAQSLPPLAGEGASPVASAESSGQWSSFVDATGGADGGNAGEVIGFDAVSSTATRPLTQNEIESLLADFPAATGNAGLDAEALSAHVDTLLAGAADGASSAPAPWEVAAVADPQQSAGRTLASVNVAPHPDDWQLLDDPTPVVSAPRGSPATSTATAQVDGGLDFELEPMESVAPALVRERESEEMRLEEEKPARRAENAKNARRAGKVR